MDNDKNAPTPNPKKDLRLRQILDEALARRPVVNITIQVPANTNPETVAAILRQALSDFYPPSAGG